jgi:hypothetical protein
LVWFIVLYFWNLQALCDSAPQQHENACLIAKQKVLFYYCYQTGWQASAAWFGVCNIDENGVATLAIAALSHARSYKQPDDVVVPKYATKVLGLTPTERII